MAAQSVDLPLGAVCPRKVVVMSFHSIREILSSNLTQAEKELAIDRLISKQQEVEAKPTHASVDGENRYILRSVLTSVKAVKQGSVTRLVPCESTDEDACGRFLAVFGHSFQQQNKQLRLTPLSEFKIRERSTEPGKRGELRQKNLDWVVGGWALIGEQKLGGVGPSIPFTFYGHIGNSESVLVGRPSYTAKVDPAHATVEESLRLTVEGLLAGIWGHNGAAEVYGDAESAVETAKACSRIGRFGITVDRQQTSGPRFIQGGEIIDAKVVTAATGRMRVAEGTTTTTSSTGQSYRDLAAEAKARVAAARAANG